MRKDDEAEPPFFYSTRHYVTCHLFYDRLIIILLIIILIHFPISFQFLSKMGLDLIPRVDGEVVDADSTNTSVVELYKVVSSIFLSHTILNYLV